MSRIRVDEIESLDETQLLAIQQIKSVVDTVMAGEAGLTEQEILDLLNTNNYLTQTEIEGLNLGLTEQQVLDLLTANNYLTETEIQNLGLKALNFLGIWDASTNTPEIVSGGSGVESGDFYKVSIAGTTSIDGVSDWKVGDWIIFDGVQWNKIDQTEVVQSVNGQVGNVQLELGLTEQEVLDLLNTNGYTTQSDLTPIDNKIEESTINALRVGDTVMTTKPVDRNGNLLTNNGWIERDQDILSYGGAINGYEKLFLNSHLPELSTSYFYSKEIEENIDIAEIKKDSNIVYTTFMPIGNSLDSNVTDYFVPIPIFNNIAEDFQSGYKFTNLKFYNLNTEIDEVGSGTTGVFLVFSNGSVEEHFDVVDTLKDSAGNDATCEQIFVRKFINEGAGFGHAKIVFWTQAGSVLAVDIANSLDFIPTLNYDRFEIDTTNYDLSSVFVNDQNRSSKTIKALVSTEVLYDIDYTDNANPALTEIFDLQAETDLISNIQSIANFGTLTPSIMKDKWGTFAHSTCMDHYQDYITLPLYTTEALDAGNEFDEQITITPFTLKIPNDDPLTISIQSQQPGNPDVFVNNSASDINIELNFNDGLRIVSFTLFSGDYMGYFGLENEFINADLSGAGIDFFVDDIEGIVEFSTTSLSSLKVNFNQADNPDLESYVFTEPEYVASPFSPSVISLPPYNKLSEKREYNVKHNVMSGYQVAFEANNHLISSDQTSDEKHYNNIKNAYTQYYKIIDTNGDLVAFNGDVSTYTADYSFQRVGDSRLSPNMLVNDNILKRLIGSYNFKNMEIFYTDFYENRILLKTDLGYITYSFERPDLSGYGGFSYIENYNAGQSFFDYDQNQVPIGAELALFFEESPFKEFYFDSDYKIRPSSEGAYVCNNAGIYNSDIQGFIVPYDQVPDRAAFIGKEESREPAVFELRDGIRFPKLNKDGQRYFTKYQQ